MGVVPRRRVRSWKPFSRIPSQSRLSALSPGLLGLVFAAVAGVMGYISLDELLPAAEPRPPFTWLRAVPSRNC
jgi:hypothetical protein